MDNFSYIYYLPAVASSILLERLEAMGIRIGLTVGPAQDPLAKRQRAGHLEQRSDSSISSSATVMDGNNSSWHNYLTEQGVQFHSLLRLHGRHAIRTAQQGEIDFSHSHKGRLHRAEAEARASARFLDKVACMYIVSGGMCAIPWIRSA